MLISELIEKLQELQNTYGDIEVLVNGEYITECKFLDAEKEFIDIQPSY